tara:strand:- start:9904 stop:10908 length:1005 start_codon:yes stop_codon:yes gene_type:complete
MQHAKPTKNFQYSKTKSLIRFHWKDGNWDTGRLITDDTFKISYAATVLHYGQSAFEGLKAFRHADGSIHVFRPYENAKRMQRSCERLLMPRVDEELFVEAICRVVKDNHEYVPAFGQGAMYIRPFIFGSAATIGIAPSAEYEFVVLVMPVGDYYSGGTSGVNAVIWPDFDRAAPFGTGHVKAAGNYASDLLPSQKAKSNNYDIVLYLDAKTRTLIEEFGTSNFIAIDQDGNYISPKSPTILESITNDSLRRIAETSGMQVECRKVPLEELKNFREIGACGTAVVITPIANIDFQGESIWHSQVPAKRLLDIKATYQAIQNDEQEDIFSWLVKVL